MSEFEIHPGIDAKAMELALAVQRKVEERKIADAARTAQKLTGKRPTIDEVARENGITPSKASDILAKHRVLVHQLPVVRKGALPENEEAFFRGLHFGDFAFDSVERGSHRFVTIATESQDPSKHKLLKVTAGTWGEVTEFDFNIKGRSRRKTKVYLNNDTFPFLTEEKPVVGSRIMLSHQRFPPFLLGLETAKLTDAQSRVSLRDVDFLQRVHTRFEAQFGFPLGHFRPETRDGKDGKKLKYGVVVVRQPGEVFAALAQVESVSKLPFFRELARIRLS